MDGCKECDGCALFERMIIIWRVMFSRLPEVSFSKESYPSWWGSCRAPRQNYVIESDQCSGFVFNLASEIKSKIRQNDVLLIPYMFCQCRFISHPPWSPFAHWPFFPPSFSNDHPPPPNYDSTLRRSLLRVSPWEAALSDKHNDSAVVLLLNSTDPRITTTTIPQ